VKAKKAICLSRTRLGGVRNLAKEMLTTPNFGAPQNQLMCAMGFIQSRATGGI